MEHKEHHVWGFITGILNLVLFGMLILHAKEIFGDFPGFIRFLVKLLAIIFCVMIIWDLFTDPYAIWISHKIGYVGCGIFACLVYLRYNKTMVEEDDQ